MSEEYRNIFILAGIGLLCVFVYLSVRDKPTRSASWAEVDVFGVTIRVTGEGVAVAAVGLACLIVPVLFVEARTPLEDREHPVSLYQLCVPPDGAFRVVATLPDGPLNVRLGAGIQHDEITALRAGTAGLRFDQCVIRHDGTHPWWRIEDSGWLYSKFVERD